MAEFDSRIEKAALVIKQKAITRAGAAETSSQSLEATTDMPPKISTKNIGLWPAEARLNSSCHIFGSNELSKGSARNDAPKILSIQIPKSKPDEENEEEK